MSNLLCSVIQSTQNLPTFYSIFLFRNGHPLNFTCQIGDGQPVHFCVLFYSPAKKSARETAFHFQNGSVDDSMVGSVNDSVDGYIDGFSDGSSGGSLDGSSTASVNRSDTHFFGTMSLFFAQHKSPYAAYSVYSDIDMDCEMSTTPSENGGKNTTVVVHWRQYTPSGKVAAVMDALLGQVQLEVKIRHNEGLSQIQALAVETFRTLGNLIINATEN